MATEDTGTDAGVRTLTCDLQPLMWHLPFVEWRDELSCDDAAERCQRLLSLVFRQPIPQLIAPYGPAANLVRGGTITAISSDMSRLLGPILGGFESIPTAVTGR